MDFNKAKVVDGEDGAYYVETTINEAGVKGSPFKSALDSVIRWDADERS